MNWANVKVEHGQYSMHRHRIVLPQCAGSDKLALDGRCGREALYTVTRTSTLSGTLYCDYLCEAHAKGWGPLPAAN